MSSGADLFYMDHDAFTGQYTGPVGALVMSGDIDPGDYERLLGKIGDDPQRFLSQDRLILASAAGDAHEAMKIGRLLQALHTEVSVSPLTGRCVGVCFLIYVAADQRSADGAHLLGIQGATAADATAVRDFLRENEVPAELADRATRPASGDVYWLSDADETRLDSRSASFTRYLVTHCHWDDDIEHALRTGKRPVADMKDLWACRHRVTRSDAAVALAAAQSAALKGQSTQQP
jgi:hypothetical protein